jgi:hypothetical protein
MGPLFGMEDVSPEQTTSKIQETLDVVRQINVQFKDPVGPFFNLLRLLKWLLGAHDVHLRLYPRVLVDVRNGAFDSRVDQAGIPRIELHVIQYF